MNKITKIVLKDEKKFSTSIVNYTKNCHLIP